jgi:class 3 adenylate cyclase
MRTLLGDPSDADLRLGEHVVMARVAPVYERNVDRAVELRWLRENVGHMLDATPGGRETLLAFAETPEARAVIERAEPQRFPAWTDVLDWGPVGEIRYFALRLRGPDAEEYGTIYLYGANLPATLLTLVARGDMRMFARMARLTEPGRHEAAVLFADLQASSALSRRLPTPAYFELVRDLTSTLDSVVIEHGGIVGKHAGDGAVAFFLVEDLGSGSAAARAAIEAGREVADSVHRTALPTGETLALNVGLHWGGTLYMGQLITDGRLEVTALGDEVNECARIQESARDGAVLATKPLIERLDAADAAAVGLDPAATLYRALAELESASEKAVRDAGGVAVTRLDGG